MHAIICSQCCALLEEFEEIDYSADELLSANNCPECGAEDCLEVETDE